MRKRLKTKLYFLRPIQPHKMGWDNLWEPNEAVLLSEAEKELDEVTRFIPRAQKGVSPLLYTKNRGLLLATPCF